MANNKETRAGLAPRRASDCVTWTADTSEDALALLTRQASVVARRLGLTLTHARLIAEHAFRVEARPYD